MTPRPRGRPFEKGQSGNPGGRPRIIADVRNLARQYLPAAIDELARLGLKAKSEAVRITAIRELIDRGFGKATSPPVAIRVPAIDEYDGNEAVLRAVHAIVDAVAEGDVSPGQARELLELILAQHAAVKDIRPGALYPKPTPEQLGEWRSWDGKLKPFGSTTK
jgi:hypothetical protein